MRRRLVEVGWDFERAFTTPDARFTHKMSSSRLYHTWRGMLVRCQKPESKAYRFYGARGITVCDEWQSFEPFMNWALANGYSDDLTIERNDVMGSYTPANCSWATRHAQMRNQRSNVWVELWGERKIVTDWLKDPRISLSRGVVWRRINSGGWDPAAALTVPKMAPGRHATPELRQGPASV